MGSSENPLKRLIHEIHRRSLWHVLGIYVVGSWVALQAAELLAEAARLPEWFLPLALGILIVGLPVVLATALVQEDAPIALPSEGKATEDSDPQPPSDSAGAAPRSTGPVRSLFTWRNAIGGGFAASVLWMAAAMGWYLIKGDTAAPEMDGPPITAPPSIAVLPLENLSGDPEQEYFSAGLSEEIINALTQVRGLKVAARTSSFAFSNSELDIRTIADSLGVATVLEGSVRRFGNRVRITAQLIEAETGFHLWSETYERDMTDLFAVQDAIARSIRERLEPTPAGTEAEPLVQRATHRPEAHEAYLRGKYLWNQRTAESLHDAIAHFRHAVELDPEYAEAFAGLAETYALLAQYADAPPHEVNPVAKEMALRALELDSTVAPAYTALSEVQRMYEWDWEGGRRSLERALGLNPGYATARQWYGNLFRDLGEPDSAIQHIRTAQEMDPLSPIMDRALGRALFFGRRYAEAADLLERSLSEKHTDFAPSLVTLSQVYLATGRSEEALHAIRRARELAETSLILAVEAYALAVSGQRVEAEANLEDLMGRRERGYVPAYTIALVHLGLGRTERALDWLERAYDERSTWMNSLGVHPFFDPLRGEPRFDRLLERLALGHLVGYPQGMRNSPGGP